MPRSPRSASALFFALAAGTSSASLSTGCSSCSGGPPENKQSPPDASTPAFLPARRVTGAEGMLVDPTDLNAKFAASIGVRSSSGAPLAARVTAGDKSYSTHEAGALEIPDLGVTEELIVTVAADGHQPTTSLISFARAGGQALTVVLRPADVQTKFAATAGFGGPVGKGRVEVPAGALIPRGDGTRADPPPYGGEVSMSAADADVRKLFGESPEAGARLVTSIFSRTYALRVDEGVAKPAMLASEIAVDLRDDKGAELAPSPSAPLKVELPIAPELFHLYPQESSQPIHRYDPQTNQYTQAGTCTVRGQACAGTASDSGRLALLLPPQINLGWACAKVDSTALAYPMHLRPIARHVWIEGKPTDLDVMIPAETRYLKSSSGELGLYGIFTYSYSDERLAPRFTVASRLELSADPEEGKHAGTNLADQTRSAELRSGFRDAVKLGLPASATQDELWAACAGSTGTTVVLTAPGLDPTPPPSASEGGEILQPPPPTEPPPPCSAGQIVWNDLSGVGTVPENTPHAIPIPGWPQGATFSRTDGIAVPYTPPATENGGFFTNSGQPVSWQGSFPYLDILPPVGGTITFDFKAAATTRGERWRFVLGQGGTSGSAGEGPVTIQSNVPLYALGKFDAFASGSFAEFKAPSTIVGSAGSPPDGLLFFTLASETTSVTLTLNDPNGSDPHGYVVGMIELSDCSAGETP